MPQLKMKNEKFTLIGSKHVTENLNLIQVQNLMLKLDYPPEALFDCLVAMAETGNDTCELGLCGGFMWSYKDKF